MRSEIGMVSCWSWNRCIYFSWARHTPNTCQRKTGV